jgi:hypothetical protein
MTPTRTTLLRLWAAALLLSACGGGVETGGTGSYVEGPVQGFGSVIVGGVQLDEAAARIEDSEGQLLDASALRLGMRVEVDADALTGGAGGVARAAASRVRIAPELLGPVTGLHGGSPFVDVLGQSVRITAATVVDGVPGGVAGLAPGDLIEVHGFPEPLVGNDRYVATRIERRGAAAPSWRVRGVVRNLDAVARTLRIGQQSYDLAAIDVPTGLANGQVVRLTVQTAPLAGLWAVLSLSVESRRLPDRDAVELEGLVTAATSSVRFEINGVEVDASGATFLDGSGGIVPGARVKLRGRAVSGVLVAASVDLRSDGDAYNDGVDLRGPLSAVDSPSQTFVARGVTVFHGSVPPPAFVGGSAADLTSGRNVRVHGQLSADGTRVVAAVIEFLNP